MSEILLRRRKAFESGGNGSEKAKKYLAGSKQALILQKSAVVARLLEGDVSEVSELLLDRGKAFESDGNRYGEKAKKYLAGSK